MRKLWPYKLSFTYIRLLCNISEELKIDARGSLFPETKIFCLEVLTRRAYSD